MLTIVTPITTAIADVATTLTTMASPTTTPTVIAAAAASTPCATTKANTHLVKARGGRIPTSLKLPLFVSAPINMVPRKRSIPEFGTRGH